MRQVQDHYFHQAKREGYLSRAAYKLIEIDERKKVLRRGDFVLDVGCAPGSWLQVAARRVGSTGSVVGIDLQPIRQRFDANVRVVQGDFVTTPVEGLRARLQSHSASGSRHGGSTTSSLRSSDPASPPYFDVVFSDMAPATTGDPSGDHHLSARLCEAVLDRCGELLKPGGKLVMKVFEGERYRELLQRTGELFETCKGYKPGASRSESREMYIVAAGFRGGQSHRPDHDEDAIAPPRKQPRGWKSAQP